ncbi:two component transcriptional regulator, LuxR family [Natronincola peptidivorans]|uniref:Stage 0 sporulation protein A homolog n=1 Tax=Natronincola peptidivorans TaxID=426128 RepID=A0A1I0H8H4_9FIRM|nr:response regulator transcription factor [Natronincola peptidivorans]SET79115.1 two component transcriptional regulator, LuxR family [Natronincola peptidivorans]
MIKMIIADDQSIITAGLRMIFEKEEDIEICATASNGQEAVELTQWYKPAVVLMDIKMPILDGIEATKQIKSQIPDTKVLLLTTFQDDELIHNALSHGACGYLLKDAEPKKILEAVRIVASGGALLDPQVTYSVIQQFNQLKKVGQESKDIDKIKLLTDRELEIVKELGQGKNNKEIGEYLHLGEGTVKNHITKILEKLELRDRTQLAIFSIKNDLI